MKKTFTLDTTAATAAMRQCLYNAEEAASTGEKKRKVRDWNLRAKILYALINSETDLLNAVTETDTLPMHYAEMRRLARLPGYDARGNRISGN